MGSFNSNSFNVRLFVIVFVAVVKIALCRRNCSSNFSDRERPVPSYPLIVDDKNIKQFPSTNNFLTSGNGIAAASSIINNSH